MEVLTVDYNATNAPTLFCQSLKKTGFAVLSQHPISTPLINQAYQQWQNFFYSDDKHHYLYQKPSQDGYFPFRTEKAKNRNVSDLKEFYHFYPWGRIPPATKEISFLMCNALTKLAAELLQWIENFLPQHVAQQLSMPLQQMINDSPNTLLRILHYPPINAHVESGAVRAAPHEDINLITLLPAATAPGLEVLDITNNWHSVTCDPGNIVVNVGDMLQMCTQQYYKSTTHRVINPTKQVENTSRFSMPLFLHPQPNVYLAKNCTAEEYLNERLREIGIY
jgi:isopenicillin N synthase-like dioxygenase